MEFVSRNVLRALWYVKTMQARGVGLTVDDVNRFAVLEPPHDARRQSPFAPLAFLHEEGSVVRDAEPVADYLGRIGWVAMSSGSVVLTELGRAILATEEQEDASAPLVTSVVLNPDDPLVYVHLTRFFSNAGAGLLVDGYFKADMIEWLVQSTAIRRVLVSARHHSAKKDLGALAVALGTVPGADAIEVRSSEDGMLHDRCVIAPDQTVKLLGSSVNGVGKHLTAIIQPSPDIMTAYRSKYEKLWQEATPLAPQAVQVPKGKPIAQ